MDALFQVFQAIGDAIAFGIDFVVTLFLDLVWLIQFLGNIVGAIPSYFSWLPPELLAILVAVIGAAFVLRIMGR